MQSTMRAIYKIFFLILFFSEVLTAQKFAPATNTAVSVENAKPTVYNTPVTNVLPTGNANNLRNKILRDTNADTYFIDAAGVSQYIDARREVATIENLQAYKGKAQTMTVIDSLRGGLFKLRTATGNTVNNGIVFSSNISGYVWVRQYDGNIFPEYFGAKGDSVTNDYTAFLNTITYIESLGAGVLETKAKYYKLNTGLVLSPQKIRLKGNNTTLDFTGAPSTVTAVAWLGAGAGNPYLQADKGMSGFIIKGASSLNSSVGIKFSAPSTLAAAHFKVENCTVTGFGVGQQYGDNAYLISNYNCDIWGCFRGVYIPPSLTNSGEGIKYFGGTIFNNKINLDVRWEGTTVMMIGTSLDYPDSINIYMEKGRLMLNNAHIEGGACKQIVVANGGAFESTITMNGGLIYNSSSGGTTPRVDIAGKCTFSWTGGNAYNQGGGGVIIRGNLDAKIVINNVFCETQSDDAFFTHNGASFEINSKQYGGGVSTSSEKNIYADKSTGSQVIGLKVETRNAGVGQIFASYSQSTILGNIAQTINNYNRTVHATTTTTANSYGLFVETPVFLSSGGITNNFGLYIGNQSPAGVSSGRAIFQAGTTDFNFFAGKTKFGSLNLAESVLDVESTTSGLIFPRMTSTQRDAITPNVNGMVIYNSTTNKLQVRAAGAWVDLH